ncbi:MAG: hypothetical protein HFG72_09460 [Hungatella sp.]|nr:hypothetical protein [Hungatella sp.]
MRCETVEAVLGGVKFAEAVFVRREVCGSGFVRREIVEAVLCGVRLWKRFWVA